MVYVKPDTRRFVFDRCGSSSTHRGAVGVEWNIARRNVLGKRTWGAVTFQVGVYRLRVLLWGSVT